jgi:hypothetical protein
VSHHFADESLLTKRFKDMWEVQFPAVPVDYLGQSTAAVNGRLVRFRILRAPTRQVALRTPARPMRNYGSVVIYMSVPTGDGPGELLEMVDFISAIFLGFRSNGVLCKPPSLTGPREEGTFLVATVDVPFTSDYSV